VRILLTGASGLLGKYLLKSANFINDVYAIHNNSKPNHQLKEVNFIKFDLLNTKKLDSLLLEISPDIIIHTAAEGNVDMVQNSIAKFYELNVSVACKFANYSKVNNSKFIFISSNSVFGGSNETYADDSELNPINDYGRLKATAERKVKNIDSNALIIRPILMYGWPSPNKRLNPVIKWITELRLGKKINVVNDIYTQPLAAWDCAHAIWKGIEIGATDSINVSGGTLISLYDFAVLTSEVFELNPNLIHPVTSSFFHNLAPRPFKTAFDLKRLITEFKINPDIPRKGLERLRKLEKDQN
jgi:dTDP-4-dehydrorhamnose reductase